MENHLLEIIKLLAKEKEEQPIFPKYVLYKDLIKRIREGLNTLYRSKQIKVGDTANDKFIEIVCEDSSHQ